MAEEPETSQDAVTEEEMADTALPEASASKRNSLL